MATYKNAVLTVREIKKGKRKLITHYKVVGLYDVVGIEIGMFVTKQSIEFLKDKGDIVISIQK